MGNHHVCENVPKCHFEHEKNPCHNPVKGFNLCRRRQELRCFKHCEPISQPCDSNFQPYFSSRTNIEFSGLIVVTNTGNPTSGCSMSVRITDRLSPAGAVVATVNPGASIPIFVEGITLLEIACIPNPTEPAAALSTCSGEIVFDLDYCASRVCF
ncbi:DUF3992 domain-containing protein [Neobacillus sp. PS3-12]|jgi:hypothetical protein|uniref:S-Ena type endospore appendage n=1 Tax=Neobacillus sp. PS3-12 TaxID=3070677 RepID=UPI0027E1BEE5|nr:S-Ena type endospore appendage [Neobacillus sp. PS3-12]WML53364.1 DUF3992 domain-containing protein [Neobacillus sp. PS3-12]